jgi:zinc transporter 1/2/3
LFIAARELLQHAHAGHGHDKHEAEEHHAEEGAAAASVYTLDLRIIAIFVVWVGAVVFGLPTLVFKQFRSQDAAMPRMFRAFAGGTVVALALVHIIPETVHQLEGLLDFHLAGCTILFGILALVLVDSSLAAYMTPDSYKQELLAKAKLHHHHEHDSSSDLKQAQDDMEAAAAAAAPSHGHQCLRGLNTAGWVSSAAAPMRNVRQYVTAYTMELGCIFHSVIIGIGVGVVTNDRGLVITLMIALAIHQGLEALALGSVLAATSFSLVKRVVMLFLYTITTPIGIAIGISIASSYDPDSVTSKAVAGVFNGVSSGMLIYIGMYQLIAEEFSREDLLVRPGLRYGMYASLFLGAACMTILGIWA